ncbi:MAG: hypothetical protein KAI64_00310, partial [Thermoplasmata archaeon]|nr:hypothetical protein [Thermoplasmata archaeon]
MALDSGTIQLIVGLGILLVFVVVILIMTRRFSKKSLRRYLSQKGDIKLESDKAYNSVTAVRAISESFDRQGVDVSSVKKIIGEAKKEMNLKNYSTAIELAERAKEKLVELKKTKERAEREEGESKAVDLEADDFESSSEDEQELTAKETLQKKYPPNFIQSKFTIGVVEDLVKKSNDRKVLDEAEPLLKESKDCFQREEYDRALQLSLQCRKRLEDKKAYLIE